MEFIAKNYFLIIIIAAFLLFALIGYMVDTEKKRKKSENNESSSRQEDVKEEIVQESPENRNFIPEIEETKDDIASLKKQIKSAIMGKSPADRPAMQTKVKESGLPLDYTKYTSVDDLKKFLEIIK